ncbi:MAG TPA: hypothetical protein VKU36_03810 [Candidatus Babeliales bacterium]|nr:hypothetical protein [Candidatus Babeliales bacterium]
MKHCILASMLLPVSVMIAMEPPITEIPLKNYELDTSKDFYITLVNKSEYTIDFFHEKRTTDILQYYKNNPEKPHPFGCPVKTNESLKFPINKNLSGQPSISFHFYTSNCPIRTYKISIGARDLQSDNVIEITSKNIEWACSLAFYKDKKRLFGLYLPKHNVNEKK